MLSYKRQQGRSDNRQNQPNEDGKMSIVKRLVGASKWAIAIAILVPVALGAILYVIITDVPEAWKLGFKAVDVGLEQVDTITDNRATREAIRYRDEAIAAQIELEQLREQLDIERQLRKSIERERSLITQQHTNKEELYEELRRSISEQNGTGYEDCPLGNGQSIDSFLQFDSALTSTRG